MFNWKDRVYVNARKKIFKNLDTNEMLNLEIQEDEGNILEESETPLTAYCLNQAQQELVDDMSKTYIGTNIEADTIEGVGRINKVYGKTEEVGTGEKSPTNPYKFQCVGDDVNLFDINDTEIGALDQSNGQEAINYTAYRTKNYISVSASSFYIFSGLLDERRVFEYDGNKQHIKNYLVYNNQNFQTSSNAAFIKTHGGGRFNTKTKLQKGTVTTPYSPYGYSTVEVISKNGSNTSSNICYIKNGLSENDYIDYNFKKVVRANGTEEDINCSNKITQYDGQTTVYNRDNAEIEVSLTNNKAISEINEDIYEQELVNRNKPEIITNNSGIAYKFPSGMLVCTGDVKANFPVTKAWGSLYELATDSTAGSTTFAVPFIAKPFLTATQVANGSGGILRDVTFNEQSISRVNWTRTSSGTAFLEYNYIAIGRWK